jgi:Iron/manganese superoxide dismutases, alpha-hairpin domain
VTRSDAKIRVFQRRAYGLHDEKYLRLKVLTCMLATAPVRSPQFTLPTLPWAENALDPVISANTISFHYGKHHKTCVDNLNKFVAGTEFADMPLEKIVSATAGEVDKASIFNNAAQVDVVSTRGERQALRAARWSSHQAESI